MHDLRMYHSTAVLLPDGRVLVAGGGRLAPAIDYSNAEIYSPPYLFRGARPTISAAPAVVAYGSTFSVQTPDAGKIASVALIRLATNTHAFDSDQRYVNLTYTRSSDGLLVTSPANATYAPPGFYHLFILDNNGVPSVSTMIQVGTIALSGSSDGLPRVAPAATLP
jgi:hypothetical protein